MANSTTTNSGSTYSITTSGMGTFTTDAKGYRVAQSTNVPEQEKVSTNYFESGIANFSKDDYLIMLDRMSRTADDRRIWPLDYNDNIKYKHRTLMDEYTLRIGDTWFLIPPTFIHVSSSSTTSELVTLRQENSQKMKSGYHKRVITIDLVLSGKNQINGYKVKGPEGHYYVDGLRALLAQFHLTPFLPVYNEMLNLTYGIANVILQSITVNTVDAFPDILEVHLILQEITLTPYIEVTDVVFPGMIDWDLFRFYYQRMLTEDHEYKKLQSIPADSSKNYFKLSILDGEAFMQDDSTVASKEENFLDIITDKKILKKGSKTNYITWVDAHTDPVYITRFTCQYANLLTQIQMSDQSMPTTQFIGGMDTIFDIVLETTSEDIISNLEQCRIENDYYTRKNIKYRSVGFVKLESELVALMGATFVVIDNMETNTVPAIPGLYEVHITCVAYDIAQGNREALNGFLPFDCNKTHSLNSDHVHTEQAIDQTQDGLSRKINQDIYAESKLRSTMEVYPDLRLPTYDEVNDFITKCNKFRSKNGLSKLPYTKYPLDPTYIMHGTGVNGGVKFKNGTASITEDMKNSVKYQGFVDPDFYVFYPSSYVNWNNDTATYTGQSAVSCTSSNRDSIVKNKSQYVYDYMNADEDSTTSSIVSDGHRKNFAELLKNRAGSKYLAGATGPNMFDSSGLVSWGLKAKGITNKRITAKQLQSGNLPSGLEYITKDQLQMGDIMVDSGHPGHVAVYYSPNRVIECGGDRTRNVLGYPGVAMTEATYNDFSKFIRVQAWSSVDKTSSSSVDVGSPAQTNTTISSGPNLTQSEFNEICRYVRANTKGEKHKSKCRQAVAQYVYDRLCANNFIGLNNILDTLPKSPKSDKAVNANVEADVKAIFCDGKRVWPTSLCKMCANSTDSSMVSSIQYNDKQYDRFGSVGNIIYWGRKGQTNKNGNVSGVKIPTVRFTISNSAADQTGAVSQTGQYYNSQVRHQAYNVDVSKFGVPLLVDPRYDNFADMKVSYAKDSEAINKSNDQFNASFVDEVAYSRRGRLLRAFPAYLFCILDEDASWYDGRKLWTNYYTYRSVVDIASHSTNDSPISTATVTVTNSYHNLSRTPRGLSSYSIKDDPAYTGIPILGKINKFIYETTGIMPGLGPKLTDKLIKIHQVIYNIARLREGARIHIRLGYGSDPMGLAPLINGFVTDVQIGDQITVVVSSDGVELTQHITSSNEKDTNNGLWGMGGKQESSNIIASVLLKRSNWMTHLCKGIFEGSKYSIEHFGLYMRSNSAFSKEKLVDITTGAVTGFSLGALVSNGVITTIAGLISAALPALGLMLGAGGAFGLFGASVALTATDARRQKDILKNVYVANYKGHRLIDQWPRWWPADSEQNIIFQKFNMTPWDTFQICTQQVPEYIVKPGYHQFDSRLYFGIPSWMERYRTDIIGGKFVDEAKTAAQVHLIDSMSSIINNATRVTSKYTNTNIKVLYGRHKKKTSTKVIHSDDSIDNSKQKTTILDTPIYQNFLGPDAIWELMQVDIAAEAARRVGISNLIYQWNQEYQGELLILGNPGIKPDDYVLISDTFTQLIGIALVREVSHMFNINMGYTTTITLGLIAFSTDENSGMIEVCQNYLQAFSGFMSCITARIAANSNAELCHSLLMSMRSASYYYDTLPKIAANIVHSPGGKIAIASINVLGTIGNVALMIQKGQAMYSAVSTVFTIAKSIDALKAGLAAASAANPIFLGFLVGLQAVEILASAVIDWLRNRNVIVTLPLWYENDLFIAGAKDGEKITLQNRNKTDEEDQSDGYTVEDNEE